VSHQSKSTYDPNALWRRTALDVGSWFGKKPNKWEARADRLKRGSQEIEREVLDSKRLPAESEREQDKYEYHPCFQGRLKRTIAFGQWAVPATTEMEMRDAQHGLFGTCAAIQVLSKSAWAEVSRKRETPSDNASWLNTYLRTVNFLDLVVEDRLSHDGPELKVAAELNVTLRACHAARALAAAAPVLADLSANRGELADAMDPSVLGDLQDDLAAIVPRLAPEILETLSKVRVPHKKARQTGFRPANASDRINLYTFTAIGDDQRDLPDNVDDWVFVYSSVLVALVRAWAADLTRDTERAVEICPIEDFLAFRKQMEKPPGELDDRLRLFGLWALSHLDDETPGGPLGVGSDGKVDLPPSLTVNDGGWLTKEINAVCGRLLRSEIGQADTYSPYSFRIDTQKNADYKTDSLVVPVVPLLLALIARYDPTNLSRRPVLGLIHACLDIDARTSPNAARPFQLSTRDGIVNLSYYQEACQELALASARMAEARWRRVQSNGLGILRDFGAGAAFLVLLVATIVSYLLVTHSNLWEVAFLYGILASAVAAIAFHGVVRWVWGDS
jgi:hypothetical protein